MSDHTLDKTTGRRMSNSTFAKLQIRIDRGEGLLAREWDKWTEIFKQLDPEDYAAHQAKAKWERVMQEARAVLSLEDLRAIIAEKDGAL